MIARLTALFVLTFALVAGSLAVADRVKLAQAPHAPAEQYAGAGGAGRRRAGRAAAPPSRRAIAAARCRDASGRARARRVNAAAAARAVPPRRRPWRRRCRRQSPRPPRTRTRSAEDKEPAKQLFSHAQLPSLGKAMAIGYYPRGCLQGGVELPVDGPNWQVMRLSRNRNWGHPELVNFLEKFAPLAAKATGWNGIMVGDMAQPRGGPLPFGHMSHQIGLDVDIWFMPMPDHRAEQGRAREDLRQQSGRRRLEARQSENLDAGRHRLHPHRRRAARGRARAGQRRDQEGTVPRPRTRSTGAWMDKVRPWYGHHDHIHVRLKCPADSPNCRKQPPVPGDDGCGAKELDYWFSDKVLHPQDHRAASTRRSALTLADLPPACKNVLDAPANPQAARTSAETTSRLRHAAARWCISPAPARSSIRSRRCLRGASASVLRKRS